jgi:hypothetical protein
LRWRARACIPNGNIKWFYHSDLSSFWCREKNAGCGRVRSRNMCFGHVLVAVYQGQRRDAAATEEERLGRCSARQSKYIRLYRYSGKLATTGESMYRWHLRQKTSAWASGGPAGGRRMAACLWRWRALPQHGPPHRAQRPHIRWIAFLNYGYRSGPIAVPDRYRCSRGEAATFLLSDSLFCVSTRFLLRGARKTKQ